MGALLHSLHLDQADVRVWAIIGVVIGVVLAESRHSIAAWMVDAGAAAAHRGRQLFMIIGVVAAVMFVAAAVTGWRP